MTHEEQRRMVNELRDYVHRMSRRDQEEFDMFVKRKKDDEDLDLLSQKRLQAMYETYVARRKRP